MTPPDGNLADDAAKLDSTFGKLITKLAKVNEALAKMNGSLTRTSGSSGTGNVGAANGIPLGTDNATFTNTGRNMMDRLGAAAVISGNKNLGAAALGMRTAGATISGINAMMPDMGATMSRASGYYNAAMYGGFSGSRRLLEQTTLRTLGNGMTGVGSDANVAAILAQSGISPLSSVYLNNVRNVKNSALMYGISNEQAASSLAGLTAGPTSGMLMSAYGINTSDPRTGKMLSEQKIFEQFYQRATAGRGKATVAQTEDSLHRGFLGQAIANSGLDETEQRKLAQYFIGKAGGSTIDLSNNTTTQKLLDQNAANGNANPLRGVYQQNQISTRQQGKSEQGFISGLEAATTQLEGLADAAGNIASVFSGIKGYTSTASQNPMVQGISNFVNSMFGGGGTPAGMSTSSIGSLGSGVALNTANTGGSTPKTSGKAATGASRSSASLNGPIRMILPLQGNPKMTCRYGTKDTNHPSGHNGNDYAVAVGTAVYAAADGKVIHASGTTQNTYKSGDRSLGLQVHIDHGNGVVSIYGHLSSVSVGVGQDVSQGTMIGASGNSGFSTGPHLHFQVNEGGNHVDPNRYLGASNSGSYSSSNTSTSTGASSGSSLATNSGANIVGTGVSGVNSSQTNVATMLSSYSPPPSVFTGGGTPEGVSGASGLVTAYTGNSQSNSYISSGKSGAPYKNHVQINLTIAKASDTEAHAFAQKVKRILEQDNLMNSMGAR